MKLFSTLFCCVVSFQLLCQAPAIDWDKTFGNGNFNNATSLVKTADGGFLLGGSDNSTNDFTITKVDARGNQLWQKSYDNNGNSELLISIATTSGGGFVLGGTTIDPKTYDSDILIMRVDDTGVLQWKKQLIGNGYDGMESLQVDLQGNIIIAGNSPSSMGGDKSEESRGELDMWIIKLSPNGNKVWDKTIGGSAVDLATGVQVSTNGEYVICGYSLSNTSGEKSENSKGDMDFWVLKLRADGSKVWDKTLGGSAVDVATNLVETGSGEIVVVGLSNSQASGDKTQNTVNQPNDFDYWVVKLSSQGTKIWDKDFGGADGCNGGGCWNDGAGEVAILNNGILIGGNSPSNSNQFKSSDSKGGEDIWLIKLDNDGNLLWDKTIGGDQSDRIFTNGNLIVDNSKITLLANSNSAVSGDKSSPLIGPNDYWLVSLVAEISDQNTCFSFSETQTVVSFNQGMTKGGRVVSALRSDPSKAIGKSNANDSPKDGIQFVSLGFGGSITLEFEKPLCDKPGNDLRVVETSYGNPSFAVYPEQAEILVSQDGSSWQSLGRTNAKMPTVDCGAKLDTEFDISGKLPWIKFVQVVDVSNPNAHRRRTSDCRELPALAFSTLADGFDLDAVEAIGGQASLSGKNGRMQAVDQTSPPDLLINTNKSGVIYPNPIEDDLVIDLSMEEELPIFEETVHVEIFDVLGKRLQSFSHDMDNGFSIQHDASSLGSGVYIARVYLGSINVSYKFVKK